MFMRFVVSLDEQVITVGSLRIFLMLSFLSPALLEKAFVIFGPTSVKLPF